MTQIVNNDKLTLILTQHGLNRIAEAIEKPSLNLSITKIKFGSGNNYEYYTPSETQINLMGPIPESELYIYKKELLEDGLTISFYTIIPENIGGFDIREVGLYETIDGVDYLFAIGTCQPFVKPTTADNYFIAVDYYVFLKSANFASIYNQIVLDSKHALVTEPDMEEMLRTFLFSDANLINQIGNNSRIIGYNRATQLYEKVTANKSSFGYITLYKNYASFLEIAPENSIFSYWVFDTSNRVGTQNSIIDLSHNAHYLSTTLPIASLKKSYNGFMSMFSMSNANFFLSSDTPVQLFDDTTNSDIPFTIAFALNPLSNEDRTLIAKSNYSTGTHTFEFQELSNGSVQIKLFTDASNYLTFTSDSNVIPKGCHSLLLSYNPTEKEFTTYINSQKVPMNKIETGTYTRMQELPGALYYFYCIPTFVGYANSGSRPTELYNSDGSPYEPSEDSEWTIENNNLYYNGNEAFYSSSDNILTDPLYKWTYNDGEFNHSIYTKVPPTSDGQHLSESGAILYNEDYTMYDGTEWVVSEDDRVQFNGNNAFYVSVSQITLYAWKYIADRAEIYGNKPSAPTSFYNVENKELYTGNEWVVTDGVLFYNGQQAQYDSSLNTSTYYPNLTSYIVDSTGNIAKPINSEVGVVSIIKDKITENKIRALSLLLCATMGINPYISGS